MEIDPIDSQEITVVMICPNHHVRVIIGKRGVNINSIMSKSGCLINVLGRFNCERYVCITGKPQNVALAVSLVSVIAEQPMRENLDLDDMDSKEPLVAMLLVPEKVCGGVIGVEGQNIQNIRSASETNIRILFSKCAREITKVMVIQGKEDGIKKAVEFVAKIWAGALYANPTTKSDYIIDTSTYKNMAHNNGIFTISQHSSQVYIVDPNIAGVIIGKKGSTIKFIRRVSGALISIMDQNERKCKIEVAGSTSSVSFALYLIDAELSSSLQCEECHSANSTANSSRSRSSTAKNNEVTSLTG